MSNHSLPLSELRVVTFLEPSVPDSVIANSRTFFMTLKSDTFAHCRVMRYLSPCFFYTLESAFILSSRKGYLFLFHAHLFGLFSY